MNKRKVGNRGEELAQEYLSAKGYIIKIKNHYTPYGEIDLVGFKEGIVYFIEVKYRRSSSYGTAREAIDHRKKKSMKASAIYYLKTMNEGYMPFKISYLGISTFKGHTDFDFIENIFE